ncbi:helix-turn-helix domain-containing protein [Sinomicrobium sp. M5D2P17]
MKREETNNRTKKRNNVIPGKEDLSVKEVLRNLKEILNLRTNKELSDVLGVRANTISTWKKRNSLDYSRLVAMGKHHKLDLNKLFSNNVFEPNTVKDIIAVPRELQYQYVSQIQDRDFLDSLPRYRFPFSSAENARAFQATDLSSSMTFKGISYVVGELLENAEAFVAGKTYIVVNRQQGIFIGQIEKDKNDKARVHIIANNHKIIPVNVSMMRGEIIEIWKVTSIIYQDFVDA